MSDTFELQDLEISKVALVRKGHVPVHQDAVIQIVKSTPEGADMSDTNAQAEESVIERIAKALSGLVHPAEEAAPVQDDQTGTSEDQETASVEKADQAVTEDAPVVSETSEDAPAEGAAEGDVEKAVEQTQEGDHAPMSGTHAHEHVSHMAVVTHDHEHSHDGDNFHGHTHVAKADLDTLVAEAVEKALADRVEKAAVSDEHIVSLINAALEPIAKAFEDHAVEFARQPLTPNVTAQINPTESEVHADPAAVRDMDMTSALRYLLHGK